MLVLLLRILAFLLAVYLLWRLLTELYTAIRERRPARMPARRVVEPRVESLTEGGKKVLRVYLPGVASERDISLKVLSESIEVRASSPRESFFKIIPKGAKHRIRTRRFKPPVLEIEME